MVMSVEKGLLNNVRPTKKKQSLFDTCIVCAQADFVHMWCMYSPLKAVFPTMCQKIPILTQRRHCQLSWLLSCFPLITSISASDPQLKSVFLVQQKIPNSQNNILSLYFLASVLNPDDLGQASFCQPAGIFYSWTTRLLASMLDWAVSKQSGVESNDWTVMSGPCPMSFDKNSHFCASSSSSYYNNLCRKKCKNKSLIRWCTWSFMYYSFLWIWLFL